MDHSPRSQNRVSAHVAYGVHDTWTVGHTKKSTKKVTILCVMVPNHKANKNWKENSSPVRGNTHFVDLFFRAIFFSSGFQKTLLKRGGFPGVNVRSCSKTCLMIDSEVPPAPTQNTAPFDGEGCTVDFFPPMRNCRRRSRNTHIHSQYMS